jgi:hypothetical protein
MDKHYKLHFPARLLVSSVLGHAQYMKAIHGGKAKNGRVDAQKIAVLLRGGMLPYGGKSRLIIHS